MIDAPAPAMGPESLLVRTAASLVSVGTERYMLELAKKSLLGKALARPDLVRQVVNKIRTEGLAEAVRQTKGRLDDPVPLGYSSAGIIIDAGSRVMGFSVGDRVACSGSGFASHAEFTSIPRNHAVKIPDRVSFEDSAFVTLGAIAIHGVRMAEPALGDRVVVLGLGLIGLLAVQILRAAGCRVLGADVSEERVRMALEYGASAGAVIGRDDLAEAAKSFSEGRGADAVVIFAATESNDPIVQAASAARERGRIVVPGLVGLDIPRKIFYEKELSFVVSRAWGPGLYDPNYELKGLDYPVSFVRWTAQRNLAQFLEMLADGTVSVARLLTHRFPIERAVEAYEMILGGKEKFIGVLLTYPLEAATAQPAKTVRMSEPAAAGSVGKAGSREARIGLVGAGLFAKGTLLPALRRTTGYRFVGIATSSGVSAHNIARKHGFELATTNTAEVIENPEINLVMILTRHGSHAALVSQALRAGKDVFVEKPLALDEAQLTEVEEAMRCGTGRLMVGFNRRFAPATIEAIKRLATVREPMTVAIRVNAGFAPADSWVHDPLDGGGRIIGEACHFVDLAQALTRSLPVSVYAESVKAPGTGMIEADNVAITLRMHSGSIATILYTASGDKGYSRERVEAFGGGKVCVIDNFKTMEWSHGGRRGRTGHVFSGVDRGYAEEMRLLVECVRKGGAFPVPFEDYVATTRATFAAVESLRKREPVELSSRESVSLGEPQGNAS